MAVLILEASTSAAKAMICEEDGAIYHVAAFSYTEEMSKNGIQDPDLICKAVLDTGASLVSAFERKIEGIALVSTWHNSLLLDARRNPKTKAYTWTYGGAARIAGQFRRDPAQCAALYQKTGCMINGTYVSFRMLHLIREKGLQVEADDLLLNQGSYLFYKMTGSVLESDSMASGSGLFNPHLRDWDDDLLQMFGLRRSNMPALCDYAQAGALNSEAAAYLGLQAGIPVITAHPDGAMNQVGDDALAPGIMTLSVGTSGALRMISPQPLLTEKPSAWCYYAPGTYLTGMATAGCCNCVDWIRKNAGLFSSSFREIDEMAEHEVLQDPNPAIFLPFLFGERSPGWIDERKGGFIGVRGYHTGFSLYRSVLEGVCFNLKQCYDGLVPLTGEPEKIHVSGGIVKSSVWSGMLASVINREIQLSNIQHASLLGGAKLILYHMQQLGSLSQALNCGIERTTVKPNPERAALYAQLYNAYLKAYASSVCL